MAVAVINPKRHDCTYPDKNLAGVGVALKLVQALCGRAGKAAWLPAFVKIAALGTLADVVPLVGENRVIAKLGLDLLSKGPHKVGLRALLEVSGLSGKRISGYDVGFVLAPRINAAGRMATPDIATRLLLASDEALADEARGLAEQLNAENVRRQQEEAAIVAEARKIVESDPEIGARTVLVVAGEGWHRGVIGIVASKLVDAYHRPAVVLSIEGDVAQGSCRSIPSFDMLAALESCALDAGSLRGPQDRRRPGAVPAAAFASSAARSTTCADALLGPDDLRPRQRIDDVLGFRELTGPVAAQIVALAPFGAGNPKPVFAATGVEIADGPRRLKERHLKMAVRQDGRVLRAIAWRGVERYGFLESHRAPIDLAYSLEQNEFNGETYLELVVADVRPVEPGQPGRRRRRRHGAGLMKWQKAARLVMVAVARGDHRRRRRHDAKASGAAGRSHRRACRPQSGRRELARADDPGHRHAHPRLHRLQAQLLLRGRHAAVRRAQAHDDPCRPGISARGQRRHDRPRPGPRHRQRRRRPHGERRPAGQDRRGHLQQRRGHGPRAAQDRVRAAAG